MNRVLTIPMFAFVAIIMGMSTISPALAGVDTNCPDEFSPRPAADSPGKDLNGNGMICQKIIPMGETFKILYVDDILPGGTIICPRDFEQVDAAASPDTDRNGNGKICKKTIPMAESFKLVYTDDRMLSDTPV